MVGVAAAAAVQVDVAVVVTADLVCFTGYPRVCQGCTKKSSVPP